MLLSVVNEGFHNDDACSVTVISFTYSNVPISKSNEYKYMVKLKGLSLIHHLIMMNGCNRNIIQQKHIMHFSYNICNRDLGPKFISKAS